MNYSYLRSEARVYAFPLESRQTPGYVICAERLAGKVYKPGLSHVNLPLKNFSGIFPTGAAGWAAVVLWTNTIRIWNLTES